MRRCENAKFTLVARLRYFLHLAPGRASTRFLVLLVDESKAAVAVAPSLNYRLLLIPIDFVFFSAREESSVDDVLKVARFLWICSAGP